MDLRRCSVKVIAAVGAALCGALLCSAPAEASAPSYCGSSHQCLWNNIHYVGADGNSSDIFEISQDVPYFYQFDYDDGLTIDKSVSSTYNNANTTKGKFRFFLSTACGGDYFTIANATGDSDFTNGNPTIDGKGVNDATRSGTFVEYAGSC